MKISRSMVLTALCLLVCPLVAKADDRYTAEQLAGFRRIEGLAAKLESMKCKPPSVPKGALAPDIKSGSFMVGPVSVDYLYDVADTANTPKLVTAIKEAIAKFQAADITLPAKLYFVLSSQVAVRNVAFMGDESGKRMATVFLGPKIFQVNDGRAGPIGVADKVRPSEKPVAVIVHELCHVAHELFNEQEFWRLKDPHSQPAPPDAAGKISAYAATNQLEFVAETFTAFLMGRKCPQAALNGYIALHGPSSVRFSAMVARQIGD